MSEPQYHKLMTEVGWLSLQSLDELIGIGKEGEEVSLAEMLPDEDTPQPGVNLLQEEELKNTGSGHRCPSSERKFVISLLLLQRLDCKGDQSSVGGIRAQGFSNSRQSPLEAAQESSSTSRIKIGRGTGCGGLLAEKKKRSR